MQPSRNTELRSISDRTALLGKHYLAELIDVPAHRIRTVEDVESAFIDILKRNGATVLGHTSHQFEPEGATVVVLLAESHASLHTWPENAAVCIDIFSCGESLDADRALNEMADYFGAGNKTITMMERKVPE